MNKLGLGTNNFKIIGSASPPIMERYSVSDCVGILGLPNVHTIEYPQGTFQLNDRVWYEFNGWPTFGYILEIGVAATDEAYIDGNTNIISQNCFDNTINLNAYNSYDNNTFIFTIELESVNQDFIDLDNEYPMYVYYFNHAFVIIDSYGEQDEREVTFTGTQEVNNYEFSQGGNYEIIGRTEVFRGWTVIDYYDQYIATEISFANTNIYTDNDCDFRYFLRFGSQFGTTFNANFRNDDCN